MACDQGCGRGGGEERGTMTWHVTRAVGGGGERNNDMACDQGCGRGGG